MSTGDVDKDKKFIDGFNRRDELIKAKKCPNGCGPMVAEQGTERCPQCGFIHVKVISGIRNWITR